MATKKTNQPSVRRDDAILADEYITIMNICPMSLTLSTEPYGKGRVINMPKFGDTRRVSYNDLVRMMDTHPTFVEKGFFYILDERVVRKHGLSEVYSKILTKEKLDQILDMGVDALELYESANETQQDFINSVLIRRIRDEEFVDYNLIAKIEKVSGVKITEKARQAQEIMREEEEVK